MLEFFKGWQGKVGFVLFLLSTAVFVESLRSYAVNDEFHFDHNGEQHAVTSHNGSVYFWKPTFNTAPVGGMGKLKIEELAIIPYWRITLPLAAVSGCLLTFSLRQKLADPFVSE